MQFERQLRKVGGSIFFSVPIDIAKHLKLRNKTKITVQTDIGKHGEFVSFWRKDQKRTKKDD